MNDKKKRTSRKFRTVFTVLAVLCAFGGIALLAGLTGSEGEGVFGGIALLAAALILAVAGWIPRKAKENPRERSKKTKPLGSAQMPESLKRRSHADACEEIDDLTDDVMAIYDAIDDD